MRQNWEERGENQDAFVAYLANERAGVTFVPQAEALRWRRRFRAALLVIAALAVIAMVLGGPIC